MRAFQIAAVAAIVTSTLSCQNDEPFQQTSDPHGLETAAVSSEPTVYVANQGNSIAVYAPGATGNVPPTATISGTSTGLSTPLGVALDGAGRLYVTNYVGNSVTVYAPGATGNETPIATISGSNTGLFEPWGIAVDGSGKLYVVNNCVFANCPAPSITVYAAGATGNTPPLATISGTSTGLHVPTGLAVDGSGKLYVANNSPPASVTVYAPGATGNVPPTATISGSNTGLNFPSYVAVDGSGKLYVVNHDPASVTVYAPGATGNETPIATISGSNTGLATPSGVAVDASGRIYVANGLASASVTVYAPGATGNVPPTATISGSNTGLDDPSGIALGSSQPPTCAGTLNEQAACLAKSLAGGQFYTFGAKGWHFGESRYLDAGPIRDGVLYTYWDADIRPGGGHNPDGKGIDCSGLVLWSYQKAAGCTKAPSQGGSGCVIRYEGAASQFHNATDQIDRGQLRAGDLIYYDFDPGRAGIDHVAMFVGGNEVVEASSPQVGIRSTTLEEAIARVTGDRHALDDQQFRRRRGSPTVALEVQALSPVDLIVSDPEGFTIDAGTLIRTEREELREVPGELYYSEGGDANGDGEPDDIVYGPTLKEGAYLIGIVPEPEAAQGDLYTLIFNTLAESVTLAANVPVIDIPSEGYGLRVSPAGITPFVPLSVDIKPRSDHNSWRCRNTHASLSVAVLGTPSFDATMLNAETVRFGRAGTEAAEIHRIRGRAARHLKDVNRDGRMDMVFHFRFGKSGFSCSDVPAGQPGAVVSARLSGVDIRGNTFTGIGTLRLLKVGGREDDDDDS